MADIGADYLVGQQAIAVLSKIFRKQTIPHAMLFSGIEGIGKQYAAKRFVMACNCREQTGESDPSSGNGGSIFSGECACASCRKIRTGNHPDIHWISPQGNYIKIDQIRALCDQLAMKPYEARRRFSILLQADTMNAEAANALLKMLEEPPSGTLFILTASRPDALLSTVRSRCQTIRFNPLPDAPVKAFFMAEENLDAGSAELLSGLSAGSLTRLTASNSLDEWMALRTWLLNVMEHSLDPEAPEQGYGDVLAFAEALFRFKSRLEALLEMMLLWLRDILICRYRPDGVLNTDRLHRIRRLSKIYSVPFILNKMDAVTAFQRSVRVNANLRLALETMAFQLSRRI